MNHYSELGVTRESIYQHESDARRLAPLLEHIEQRYSEPIRVNDAARLCAMSDCSFMHLFKDVTGQSFVAYLNSFRVARAQELLAFTDQAISEISLETGFCNQSYFGVIFRRITGMTPLQYRINHRRAKPVHVRHRLLKTPVGKRQPHGGFRLPTIFSASKPRSSRHLP